MIQGLRTAIYPVTDIAAGAAWYRDVLGCEPYFDQPFYVGFAVGGFELGLIPDGTPGNTGVTAYWGTAEIGAELQRLIGLGAQEDTPVAEVGGGIKVATVRDPYGNVLGLIENPHFDRAKVA
jgi:catechol 2,3-dioxygenase-like lactoylglutathione lyase family enzyme